MSIINKQVSVEQTRVDNIADESIQYIDTMETIDGGDHQINILSNGVENFPAKSVEKFPVIV